MERNNYWLKFFCFGFLIQALHSMYFFYLWDVPFLLLEIIQCSIGVIYIKNNLEPPNRNTCFYIYFLYVLAACWNLDTFSITGFAFHLHPSILLLLFMPDEHKALLLKWWTNLYAFILTVSLIDFLLSSTTLSEFNIVQYNDREDYIYINKHLCLISISNDIRFTSLFLEPGHTGMIAAFTILANGCNLKSMAVRLIFICSLFTFSLAAYTLNLVAFFTNAFFNNGWKKSLRFILPYILLISISYVFAKNYNNGKNFVNELIIERIEYDNEKLIVGNNRTTESTDETFTKFINTGNIIIGMPAEQYNRYTKKEYIQGAGYKLYLMKYGIIGTFLICLFYYMIYKKSQNKKLMCSMMIIYVLAFLQRAYPFWTSWIMIFTCATVLPIQEEDMDNEEDDDNNEENNKIPQNVFLHLPF